MGMRHFSSKPKVVLIACLDLKTVMLSREAPGETVIPALGVGVTWLIRLVLMKPQMNWVSCRHVES